MRRGRSPAGVALVVLLVATVAVLAASAARAAKEPRISAHLEPDPIGREEIASLTIVVESSGFGTSDVEPEFRLDNFQDAGGPFRSTSQSWVNGVTSSTTQLVWRLRPIGVGPAAVRAIRVKVDGKLMQVPDATLEVVASAPKRAAPQRRGPQDPFGNLFGEDPLGAFDRRRSRFPLAQPKLRAQTVVEPASVWAGEQLVWRLLLDTQTDVLRVEPRSLPDFRGFWVRDITPKETPAPKWIDFEGERYARVPVIERALFPRETGRVEIPKVEVDVLAQVVEADIFRPIARPKSVPLETARATVNVKPLPPAPAGSPPFSGVVGRLELSAKLDRAELETGQAASFTLRATSTGNLQSLEPPALALPEGLRSFPPTRESEEKLLGGRLESTVRWRYVLLADRPGRFAIPAVEMTYFDPASGAYRSAGTAPIEVGVRAASQVAAAPAEPGPSAPAAADGAGESRWSGALKPVAAGAATVALVALGGAVWKRRRRVGQPAELLRSALAASEKEPSARAAAAQVEEAWRRFLADRWSLARSLPATQWGERLAARGVPAEHGRELATLFEELHFLAYAPELADVEAHRAEVVSRSRRLLRRLR